ncbi:methyl-accepting chemotaxis protein, partial [Beijerinckia sp. L45]|uniref:methyl-accepting chemotaxis protein n=1 Tax=Beijerinckia sp. L45 TaxID=1641855 RepID=UPI001FEDAA48
LAQERRLVVGSVGTAMRKLAEGDLTYRIADRLPGDYNTLRDDFNNVVTRLQDAIGSITESAGGLREISREIEISSDRLSGRTSQQVVTLEETAAALHEISATSRSSAEGVRDAAAVASQTKSEALRSSAVMRETTSTMSEIAASAERIKQVIRVIDQIAFQTNLLALNAGVEAARAGEAGRGFAVVAHEVRGLSVRSTEAAREMKALIDESSKQVTRGVRLVGDTGDALQEIVGRIARMDGLISDIALSAQEQALGIEAISTAVQTMDYANQQNAVMVEEASSAVSGLKGEAETLVGLTNHFQIARAAPRLVAERVPSNAWTADAASARRAVA